MPALGQSVAAPFLLLALLCLLLPASLHLALSMEPLCSRCLPQHRPGLLAHLMLHLLESMAALRLVLLLQLATRLAALHLLGIEAALRPTFPLQLQLLERVLCFKGPTLLPLAQRLLATSSRSSIPLAQVFRHRSVRR